jgi:putative transposase
MKKTYLFAFIDDMSRLVPHGEFFLNERIDCYINALTKALAKRGLPRKLYVDNGPAFSTQILRHACASLGIALVHSRPYQPEGWGKIERFFKSVRMQFLAAQPDGLTLQDLNNRFKEWIDEYHLREHGSTREAPLARYAGHLHLTREAPKDLMDHFRKRVARKVDKDRTVSLDGRLYEAPVDMIGKTVMLLYHESDPSRVELLVNGGCSSPSMFISTQRSDGPTRRSRSSPRKNTWKRKRGIGVDRSSKRRSHETLLRVHP